MAVDVILHSVHRSHGMYYVGVVCFVLPSCVCILHGYLLLEVIGTPHTCLSSFGRAAKFKLWPIRHHWDGQANYNR